MKYILEKLIKNQNLTARESKLVLREIMEGNVTDGQISSILTALRMKGETTDEILGFINAMREDMIRINAKDAIDVCGTGGDSSGSFNISTAVALVVASAGIKVAKHGNRAASSKCGSADVLEELGININLSSQQAEEVFNKIGTVFLFAPLYHPSMKQVALVRKELKIRTIFNFLGPFVNPASVNSQLIGVPNIEIAKKLANAAKHLNYKHLLIAASEDGLDEISIFSKTIIFEIIKKRIKKTIIDPKDYGFNKGSKKDILGSTTIKNAQIINEILDGIKSPKRDIVVFNSAFALNVAGCVSSTKEGIKLAEKSIDNGSAKKVLDKLIIETNKYA